MKATKEICKNVFLSQLKTVNSKTSFVIELFYSRKITMSAHPLDYALLI